MQGRHNSIGELTLWSYVFLSLTHRYVTTQTLNHFNSFFFFFVWLETKLPLPLYQAHVAVSDCSCAHHAWRICVDVLQIVNVEKTGNLEMSMSGVMRDLCVMSHMSVLPEMRAMSDPQGRTTMNAHLGKRAAMRDVRSGVVPGPDPTHHLRHEDGHPHLTGGLWLAYSGTLYKQKLTDVREWIWNWHFVRLEIFLSPDDFLLPRAVLDVIFFLKVGISSSVLLQFLLI